MRVFFKIIIAAAAFLCVLPFPSSQIKNADRMNLYFYSASSNAKIICIEKNQYYRYAFSGITGESAKFGIDSFDFKNFINEYGAEILFTEKVENENIYYLSYPNAKYSAEINGKSVNMCVAIGSEVTVGAPIIFGGF